jgi:small subunit ribosomal protein S8
MMTDPIADMLTRIRNAASVRLPSVKVPSSRLKARIAEILKLEGFISDYREESSDNKSFLHIDIKYLPNSTTSVIQGIRRESTPGQRSYVSVSEIPLVRSGVGVTILTTSEGVLTGREARKRNIGGELLCSIW